MTTPTAPDHARRRRLIISLTAAGIVLLTFVAVGAYGLIVGPRTKPAGNPPPHTTAPPTPPTPATGPSPTAPALPPLPSTKDPAVFARAVAEALFTWDTFTTLTPDDHRAVILEAADPSGEETPGLIADLDGYLPSATIWHSLQPYRTAQTLTIDRLWIPVQWHEAVTAAGGHIRDGLVAYTAQGVRHRTGVWFNKPVSSAHQVAFTMFLSCPPATGRCVVLRLSQLDNPLR